MAVQVMGILNVTPDSFSDGGDHFTADAAIAHGLRLLDEGADWIDVGGESSRPSAGGVSEEEELRRVVPVLEGLKRAAPHARISIDTTKTRVAQAAIDAGATMVNDISGLRSAGLRSVVANAKVEACIMHMQGLPATMQHSPQYEDVVAEVKASLEHAVRVAVQHGISRERLFVDPGIGFGKTLEHNLLLLKALSSFRELGVRILVGTSRKSFLGALTGTKDASQRLIPSVVSVALLAARGVVDVVRVHDVRETVQALKVVDALA